MTTTKARAKAKPPRTLKPVAVTLAGPGYDVESGTGCVVLNGKMYYLERVADGPRTTGLAFGPLDGSDRTHHVDFTAPYGWTCDCEDATYNSGRPGGCKHLVACRQMARSLKGGAA
jgi:hypothetical protein